jgi:hypothetical protein
LEITTDAGSKCGFGPAMMICCCIVIEDGCRGIDLAGSLGAAWAAMAEAGVRRVGDLAIL